MFGIASKSKHNYHTQILHFTTGRHKFKEVWMQFQLKPRQILVTFLRKGIFHPQQVTNQRKVQQYSVVWQNNIDY